MIESKTLGAVVGIQRQGVIDKSESTALPSTSNAMIVGNFRRGRTNKPFEVTLDNYQALLGYEPTNPSYATVEDVLKQGVSSVWVMRTGAGDGGGDNGAIGGDNNGNRGSYFVLAAEQPYDDSIDGPLLPVGEI